ncbi:sensor histidine kinase [Gordonia polyisoprenivorans]|uniref:sensor histidine kinase n=1 Tax=Gordonia polyisoprenivorans TaxID=84595 RepID=UPI001AD71CE4|nr:histidine kinase [Gordonia polyisoprenivorans]QTI69991.1 histidine kinase [Gordonia polyisoprenivorans]
MPSIARVLNPGRASPDVLAVRYAVCALVIASAVLDTTSVPPWRVAPGWIATAVLVVCLVRGGMQPMTAPRFLAATSLGDSAIVIGAASVVGVAFAGGATVWVPQLGVAASALAPVALPMTAALAAVPMLALTVHWSQLHQSGWTLAINLMVAVVVFGWVHLRRYRREVTEVAAAQQEIIDSERARAVEAENRRVLAAQLHDVLAHTLSGLIITLQGAALIARREGVSADLAEKLDTATNLAKDGLGEAREAVRSLRDGPAASAAPLSAWLEPTLQRLGSATGLQVTVAGSPDDLDAEWTAVARSVVMEGLTNSLRHAAGAPVRIEFGVEGLRMLSVGDPDGFTDREHDSGGYGLAGLAERVAAAGGRLTHGPCEEGFELIMAVTT